jgi:hypothetical protein
MDEIRCPRCVAVVAANERFCAACGADIAGDKVAQDPPPAKLDLDATRKLGTARKWLLAVSILTLLTGFVLYALNKSSVEDQIRDAAAKTAQMDPAQRDALMMQNVHMTWDQAVAHDRGQVNMLLAINIGLSVVYLGLFFFAKKNALTASVIALLLFITVIAVNAVFEPTSLAQGIIVKILFIAALAKAISAAVQERKLAA